MVSGFQEGKAEYSEKEYIYIYIYIYKEQYNYLGES